ncbi:MAG: H(+)/Cl(-) exchange transporter ClcA [Phycisphaerales bacterium]
MTSSAPPSSASLAASSPSSSAPALSRVEHSRIALLEYAHNFPTWGWAILPVTGFVFAALAGWVTSRYAPQAAGSGIPHLKGVLLHVRSLNWRRVMPVKFFGGLMGNFSGLCLGREGPTVQMGAAAAQMLAPVMRTPKRDVNQLLSAGAGAGLAAAFNAPLAGLVFVIEELHREFSSRTAMGSLIAAVIATVIAQYFTGDSAAFEAKGLHALPLGLLPLTVPLGVGAGLGGVLFNRALLSSAAAAAALQKRQPVWRWLLPGLIGALICLLAWWIPQAPGPGTILAESILQNSVKLGFWSLGALLVLKFILTSISYATGAPGGMFAPMLLFGVLMGAMSAAFIERFFPVTGVTATSLAVLGMAGFFVGSVRVPLTGIVLISELTGGYELLLPICIVTLLAYVTAWALRDEPLYEALLEADLHRNGTHAPDALGDEGRSLYLSVQSGSPVAGQPISSAGFPTGCLIVGVERAGRTLLPVDELIIAPGDHISVLIPDTRPRDAMVVAARCVGI